MIIKIIKYAGTNGVAFVADFIVLVLLDTYTDIDRSILPFLLFAWNLCKFCFGKKLCFW